MKTASLNILTLATAVCIAAAEAPKLLPFQGVLSDSQGFPMPDGIKVVQFKVYDAPVGGTAVWNGEIQKLTITDGAVNTFLGSKASFANIDFNRALYLEITVDANGDSKITPADPPLLPRQSIIPSPFSKESANSRKLAGYDWAAIFGENDPTLTIPGAKLTAESISSVQLADHAVQTRNLAPAAVTGNVIAINEIEKKHLSDSLREALDLMVPPGTIISYAGTRIPPGWLLCDGAPLAAAEYPRLFDAIEVAWGAGYTNGVQVADFNLPDLRGMFLRGVSGTSYNDPDREQRVESNLGGNSQNAVGSLQFNEIARHAHDYTHQFVGGSPPPSSSVAGGNGYPRTTVGRTTNPTGGNETRPINVYVNFIIKY